MRGHTKGLLAFGAVILILLAAAWLQRSRNPSRAAGRVSAAATARFPTARPQRRDFSWTVPWNGHVASKSEVHVVAPIAGRIVSQAVVTGTSVQRGTLLFTLGGPRVARRAAALVRRRKAAERELQLAERVVGARKDALSLKMTTREELALAELSVARIESDRTQAEQELAALEDALRVRSPADGVVLRRRVSVGQAVEAGTVLVDVSAPRDLRVVAALFPPAGVALVNHEATIRATDGRVVSATVRKVLPARTPFGATLLWMEGEEVNRLLEAGEPVEGDLLLVASKQVLAVPSDAIVRDGSERPFVFVKRAGGYRRQAVETGLSSGGWIEVRKGVAEVDEVVIRGAYELFYRDFRKSYKVAD